MKASIFFIIGLTTQILFSQVSVGLTAPNSSLHIKALNNNNTDVFKISNSENFGFISLNKFGNLDINTNGNSNFINIGSANPVIKTLKIEQLTNYTTYGIENNTKTLGIDDDGLINLQSDLITNYFFKERITNTAAFGSSNLLTDEYLTIKLPAGTYEIDANIIYSTTSNSDLKLGIKSDIPIEFGYYNGAGHYGTYTNNENAVPFYLKNIQPIPELVSFGGAGINQKLVGLLKGIIKINSETTITLVYQQQSNLTIDSVIYKDSFFFAKKI